jgi:hypothetical protein
MPFSTSTTSSPFNLCSDSIPRHSRRERFHPTGPNQVWSMDFVADQLADGRRFRSLTVVDIYAQPLDAGGSVAGAVLIPLPDRAVLPGICPLSSPRGSTAPGSSDIRTALAFAQSLECAFEERFVDLCDRDIEMSRDSTGLLGRHASRSPGNCCAGTRPPAGAARALELF